VFVDAIAFEDVGSAIAFGVWGCDRFWGVWGAIAFGVWGCDRCGSAIAVLGGVGERSLLGMWECDSEARPRNRY